MGATLEHTFDTNHEAKTYVSKKVDVPVTQRSEHLGEGLLFSSFPYELSNGTFTNVYDLSFPKGKILSDIELLHPLASVIEHVQSTPPGIRGAISGGFFFLADKANATPRQLSLNLALSNSRLQGFPVTDREAIFSVKGVLVASHLRALGMISINGQELTWSGSLTNHDTDAKVYGNGNCEIAHENDNATGAIRRLVENSRYTPQINDEDIVDIGFNRRDDGAFSGVAKSSKGGIDIFAHDAVVRTHARYAQHDSPIMRVHSLDNYALDGVVQGAISTGPMLDTKDFVSHPVNSDKSLGSIPPFVERSIARAAIYETEDNRVHWRIFDGRPGSESFPGVTPLQAAQIIMAEKAITWGCFMDPGQTTKLVVERDNNLESYGNTHYLKWPQKPNGKFVWVPKTGRPISSVITLR